MKTRASWIFVSALAFGVVTSGCGKEDAPKAEGKAAPAAAAGGKGLGSAANDAPTVALVKAAIGKCDFKNHGFSTTCAEWKKVVDAPGLKKGAQDKTLVNFLEDSEEKVRWIGANRLVSSSGGYAKDKALATLVITAAEKEKSIVVGKELGRSAGRIKVKATGLKDRLQKLASSHAIPELRKGVVSKMLFNNREEYYDFVTGLAKTEKHAGVRMAAVSSFWTGTPSGKEDATCQLWLDQVKDPKEDISGEAAYLAAFFPHGKGCQKQWEPLLAKIEGWAKAGKIKESRFAAALSYLYKHKSASDAQKKRAIAVAKTLVENPGNKGSARGRALQFVGEEDAGGKAYAAKFKDDKEFFVKSTAKRVLEKKKK